MQAICRPPRSSRRGSVEIGAALIADAMRAGKGAQRPLLYCSHLIAGICCCGSRSNPRTLKCDATRTPGTFPKPVLAAHVSTSVSFGAQILAYRPIAIHNRAAEFTGIRRIDVKTWTARGKAIVEGKCGDLMCRAARAAQGTLARPMTS